MVRLAVKGAPFALAPCRPQAGGQAIEIDRGGRLAGTVQAAAVDALAEFGLGGADLGDQQYRVGLRQQMVQPLLALLIDGRMGENPSRWQRRLA